jgi:hypothetical protein
MLHRSIENALWQETVDNVDKPISYFSKKFEKINSTNNILLKQMNV